MLSKSLFMLGLLTPSVTVAFVSRAGVSRAASGLARKHVLKVHKLFRPFFGTRERDH